MGYRRRYRSSSWDDGYATNTQLTASFAWDMTTNMAYKLQFSNTKNNWTTLKSIIEYIKTTIPSSSRETTGPPDWIWYIAEKGADGTPYAKNVKELLENLPNVVLNYFEKPEGSFATKFHNKDEDLSEFKRLLSMGHVNLPDNITNLNEVTKLYRKAAMAMHPDRNPDMASEMSKLNEVWARLKTTHFKVEEVVNG